MAALPNFRIEAFESGSGTTIKLAGELDSATSAQMIERFETLAGPSGARHVMLDLAEVTFIDSTGMRAIITIERLATERGLTLTISPPPADVTQPLRASGISDRVAVAPRTDEPAPSGPFIERIELVLAREPRAPGRARAELRGLLRGRISDSDRAILTLLTSELVTNAVIHPAPAAGDSIDLRITAYDDRVRVEVGDAGAGFDPQELPPRPHESGGQGLIVVDGLSSRWGTGRYEAAQGEGFCVWFELDLVYEPETAPDVPAPEDRSVAAADS